MPTRAKAQPCSSAALANKILGTTREAIILSGEIVQAHAHGTEFGLGDLLSNSNRLPIR
jgi:hypothetical protein